MVARSSSGSRSSSSGLRRLLNGWRAALGAALSRLLGALGATGRDARAIAAGDLSPLARWPYTILAILCVLGGALARVALTDPGQDRIAAAAAGAAALGWALGRLGLMLLVLGTGPRYAARTRGAWVAGSVFWLLAVVPLAAFAAWLVSGAVSFLVLVRSRETPARARKAVGLAWGAQAVVTIVSWLTVNAWFATLLR